MSLPRRPWQPWCIGLAALLLVGSSRAEPRAEAGRAVLTVDLTTLGPALVPELMGLGVSYYGSGMWDSGTGTLHKDAAPLIHGLRPTLLRFPGGTPSDMYLWEAALGIKTAGPTAQGAERVMLQASPDWGGVGSARFIDGSAGQFGDVFSFARINGNTLSGVTEVGAPHAAGVEVRPEPSPGQPAWYMNQYGIDEHMKLTGLLGAQALITVNYGTGRTTAGTVASSVSLDQKIKRAAALVAYLNADPKDAVALGRDAEGHDWQTAGYWAQRRAARGHPAPYGVRWWEVGNEVYGGWEPGFTSARRYAEDFIAFAQAMKAVDPTIRIGAVGHADPHGKGDADDADEWNATLVKTAGSWMDFLSLHYYYPAADRKEASYAGDAWFTATMAGAHLSLAHLRDIRKRLDAGPPAVRRIRLAVTEYGIWPNESADARDYSNLARALHDADLLIGFLGSGKDLGLALAAGWDMHSGTKEALIGYDWATGKRTVRPQYHAFRLLREHLGGRLHAMTVESPTFRPPDLGRFRDVGAVPLLSGVAASDAAGRLTLAVLNRSLHLPLATTIRFMGYVPRSQAVVHSLNGPGLGSHNEQGPVVEPVTEAVALPVSMEGTQARIAFTFAPHSLTLIEWTAK
jgi:alpha-L-arabinofuranosidase